jgi:predicted RNA-binding protein associated with RNAse of E/G family
VDIDEMVTCLDEDLISLEQLKHSLTQLDKLLKIIYADKFDTLTIFIEEEERKG